MIMVALTLVKSPERLFPIISAQFSIFNDRGDIVGNNLSGLLTNVKATIIIDKVEILGQ